MNKVVNFLIKLQASEGNALSVAGSVSKELDRIKAKAGSVGEGLKRAFSPASFGSSLMAIPGMQFLTNPYTLLGAGIGAVTKLGSEAQMTAQAFTTLAGDATVAKEILADIGKFADSTPFDKLNLTANAKQMMSYGVEAKQAVTYMKQLSDISSGSAERLQSLSLVMAQVVSNGKLTGNDKMQFVNAGFNPLQELSEMTGKTMAEMETLMSKGQIKAEHVALAIERATSEGGKFYKMNEILAETVSGKWSTALGQITTMAEKLFEKIEPYLKQILNAIIAIIPPVQRAFQKLFDVVLGVARFFKEWGAELALFASILGILTLSVYAKTIALSAYAGVVGIVTMATKAWTAVQWFLNTALSANPIGAVIMAVSALTAVVVYCWHKFAGFRAFIITAWDTFKQLGSIIKNFVVDRFNEALEGIGKVGKALKALLSGDFSGAWSTFKEGVGNVLGKDSTTQALRSTRDAVRGVQGKWQANLAREQAKQESKDKGQATQGITPPSLKGSAPTKEIVFGAGDASGSAKGGRSKTGDAIATGGSRPTTINVTIGKFFDAMNVQMLDKADSSEIERVVLQALNRSLAIATATE